MELSNRALWVIVAMAALVSVSRSSCPPKNVDYVTVAEENYDRNYSSINQDGRRPLGFSKSVWYYNNADMPNPCIFLTGASDRKMEIMVQTENNRRLCFKTQTSQRICFQGRQRRCIPSGGNDVYLEFSCDDSCSEQDVRFWYRLVLGDTQATDPEGYWCDGRESDQFPDSLMTLPSDFVVPTRPPEPINKAGTLFRPFDWTIIMVMGLIFVQAQLLW